MRSVNSVAKLVCHRKEEEAIFKALGKCIESIEKKEEVIDVFDILCGKKNLEVAKPFLNAATQKSLCDTLTNSHWKRGKHCAAWLTRQRHLQMFTKAFTLKETDEWESLSNTINPVESINRQTFKSKNNLNFILENMYMEDRVHAAKMVARSNNVSIDFTTAKTRRNRKRKRSSLVNENNNASNGPPDKNCDMNDAKRLRKRGRGLINSSIEVEYQEKNEDGKLLYLGWLTGTVTAYNGRRGCLAQFHQQKDNNGNDWIPSVNSTDVRIL